MTASGRHLHGIATPVARKHIVAVVAIKLLIVGVVLVVLKLGGGYLGLGLGAFMAHVVVLAAVAAFLFLWGGLRHGVLVENPEHRAGGHSRGIVLHDAARYDHLARILTFGREGRFRDLMLRPAGLPPGEDVLDVACGTGTLAIAAARKVGPTGSVTGLDASQGMIERAQSKARQAGLDLTFVQGTAQELPFEDRRFDVVIGTLMLHHLSKPTRAAFACEALRVLRPGGRLVLIDFGRPVRRSRLPRLHRHGHVDMEAIGSLLKDNGFADIETGDVGTKNLRYVIARPIAQRLAISSPGG
ncbi:class I SAM-dependent methyltransferase [Aquamicrobium defluvii]|uniref:Methyltransferase type 11 n=1 Tax=Aquamicrobium defluvii TaxID=69279 RepID=A0A011SUD3_9HYPH|nr:methyltransferase domain-containing protein [Aquamicrobium defluvii]EXL02819.1 methyltransferase type 11 [Aquamicrobium defluvii]EZQ13303.1 ubiquinone biosynthesis protein UbiE [Halopseudomonas bauzanensis]